MTNFLLIICDDLAWGDLACHGNPYVRTPHLDRLRDDGTEQSRYLSGPLCTPARASLMTGRYHLRTRAIDTYLGRSMIDPDEPTIPRVLKQGGYATGLFGKWHLGDCAPSRPTDMGFDEALYHLGGGLRQPGNVGRNSYFRPDLMHNGRLVQSDGYCTDVFTDAAIGFIEKNQDQPFFCYLAPNAPHTPLEIAEDLVEPYRRMGLPEAFARIYAMVENIDHNVGRVLRRLDELKLAENTAVVFTSDHGLCAGANHEGQRRFNAGLRDGKGTMYEGGLRVPVLWRWPGRIAAGGQMTGLSSPIDMLPTFAAIAEVPTPQDQVIDGINLLPQLTGAALPDLDRTIFLQWHRGDTAEAFRNAACVRGDLKWYLPEGGKDELYNLADDPFEQHDLAVGQPQAVSTLRQAYADWFEDVSTTRPDNFAPPPIRLDGADPVWLTWQDWRTYNGEEGWSSTNPGWWPVEVTPCAGRFDLLVETEQLDTPHRLSVRCGEFEMSCATQAENREYEFRALQLPGGTHRFEAFLTPTGAAPPPASRPGLGVQRVTLIPAAERAAR